MSLNRAGWVLAILVVVAGLSVPVASAQASDVTVELEGVVASVPEELPGVYEVHLVAVTTTNPGPCACTQTTVELATVSPEGVDVVLSPGSYLVDWTQPDAFPDGVHQKDIRATVSVDESHAHEPMVTVTVGGTAHADTSTVVSEQVLPLDIALPVPDEGVQEEEVQAQNGSADAETSSVSEAQEASLAAPLSSGVALAALTIVGLIARRVRG